MAMSWVLVVLLYFSEQARSAIFQSLTGMTRFNISLSEGVEMVLWALDNAFGGELLFPNKLQNHRRC